MKNKKTFSRRKQQNRIKGRINKHFKGTIKFSCVSKEQGLSNSKICFKINLYKLMKKPRIKNPTLSLF